MITKYTKGQFIIILLFLPMCSIWAQKNVLDNYIDSALSNNIVLKQKNISLEKAQIAFSIAKSYYLPTTSFLMDYQTADGGRDIPLPLGDLLNGVYGTLNQLTSSNRFPQLENQSVNFLPKNFYDARIRTTLPLYNPDLKYNKQIAEQQVQLSQLEIATYQKDLIRNIKEAYFNYLLTLQAIQIYTESLHMAEDGRRTNQKLLDNGKGLHAYVIRSESEVENVKAQITSSQQKAKNAALYFNFLLNRDLSSTIDTSYTAQTVINNTASVLSKNPDVEEREEIKSLEQISLINQTNLKLNKGAFYPRLNTYLDLGSQAQNWKMNNQSRYYLFGLQLTVPIYSGMRTKNKIKQAQLDINNSRLNISQAKQQLIMADATAKNELEASLQTLYAKQKQMEAAATYQRLIERGYREGTNTFIETIDARSQYTQAKIAEQIQTYQVLINIANVERNLPYTIEK